MRREEAKTVIKPIPGIWYAVDILSGRKPFPTNKQKKGEGFKEILDKEIERLKGEKDGRNRD
jgi:hypothetical protein